MPPSDAAIDHMLDECQNLARGLTPWEESFIEDIADQWSRRRSLTERQREILERIYTEKV